MAEFSTRKRNTDDTNHNGKTKIKKKLHNETLEVVCRIAPYSDLDPCIIALDDEHVKLVPPPGVNKPEQVYKFGCVFDGQDSQRTVFRRCALDYVEDLVCGRNGLLFTYGVTGSGKTFTMTGDTDKAGILPRSLDVLFNSLPNQLEKCIFYPDGKNGFQIRSPSHAELARKQLQPFENKIAEHITESRKVLGFNNNMVSAVFVSYVEIYNEEVYDLLDENLRSNRLGLTKRLRKVSPEGPVYVENVTEIEVQSSDEALTQFLNAQQRRKVADTILNQNSSRSHSIFNIRLVMAPCEEDGRFYPVRDESKIIVSQLSLVDLAGSERTKRTENVGQRFEEGCNINKSLMTLRQCFNQLRESQRNPRREVNFISYRSSSLTWLFKSFFEGIGRIRMIICVNPLPADYKENITVLEFAELAQQVDIPEAVAPLFPLSDMANLPFSRRQIDSWHRELEQKLNLEPMQMQLFDPPPPFKNLAAPEDEETIRNLREYFIKKASQHQAYVNTVMQNAQDFSARLKKRLCYADLNEKRLNDMEIDLEEMRRYNTEATAQANQCKRQLNAMKLRLNKYECEDFVDRQREEDTRKKQQEMAAVMEQKSRTLQQAMDLVISPIFPTTITTNLTPGTSHVAELRRQFGARSDEKIDSARRPPVQLPKSAGRVPQTNPQMTMFGKVMEEEGEDTSISSLSDSFSSVEDLNLHENGGDIPGETQNLHIIRPKIVEHEQNLHENTWSMIKQPKNLHEINLTLVAECTNMDSQSNWLLKKEEQNLNEMIPEEHEDMNPMTGRHEIYQTPERTTQNSNQLQMTPRKGVQKTQKVYGILNEDTKVYDAHRIPSKESQNLHKNQLSPTKEAQKIPSKTPNKRKSPPDFIPFGMAAPKIRRSVHVGPRNPQANTLRGSLMTKLPTVKETQHSPLPVRRYQKNTANTPTKPVTSMGKPIVRRRSKSAQPTSSKQRREANDGHESDPEFVKVYKKMEQRKAQKLFAHERLPRALPQVSTPLSAIAFREGRTGYMNPKFHRRSKSVGRVLDHQPVVQVPLGTVYQKVLPGNAKSTTRLKADDLKKCDEYLITHQEVDNRGNISTELVKGEIIPTAGGGSAVKFTDIERLKHESPSNF